MCIGCDIRGLSNDGNALIQLTRIRTHMRATRTRCEEVSVWLALSTALSADLYGLVHRR